MTRLRGSRNLIARSSRNRVKHNRHKDQRAPHFFREAHVSSASRTHPMSMDSVRTESPGGTTLVPRSGCGVARRLVASAFRRKVSHSWTGAPWSFTWLCKRTAAAFRGDHELGSEPSPPMAQPSCRRAAASALFPTDAHEAPGVQHRAVDNRRPDPGSAGSRPSRNDRHANGRATQGRVELGRG